MLKTTTYILLNFFYFLIYKNEQERRKKGDKQKQQKITKAKKAITLRLNDGTIVNAGVAYEENTTNFGVSDKGTNQIKASDEKLYSKIYDSYKPYVLYEHINKDITLNIFRLHITGRYHSFNDDNNSMNFILNDDLLETFYEIYSDIEAKLGSEINDFILTNSHATNLKTKVSKDGTCFRQNSDERKIYL